MYALGAFFAFAVSFIFPDAFPDPFPAFEFFAFAPAASFPEPLFDPVTKANQCTGLFDACTPLSKFRRYEHGPGTT